MTSAEIWQTVQLRKVDDGWEAKDEQTGRIAEGTTREAAVDSLRDAVEDSDHADAGASRDGTPGPDVTVSGPGASTPAQ